MSPSPRDLWLRFETYHDVTYFTPESRAVTDELGCKGGWMGYFGMRAAPLGAAAPQTVTAAFFTFHVGMVSRALPDAWEIASPEAFLEARLRGVDGALRRMLPSLDVAEAAELAVQAASEVPLPGRVLGAANAALPVPDEPHLALWQACTTLRESRGDGHLAALVAAGLSACETLVLFGADKGLDPAYLRVARGWNEEEWRAAEAALTSRGLYDDGLTPAGRSLRAEIERRTDEAAARPWDVLGADGTARFLELMTPIALSLGRQNEMMRTNPMAIDPVGELTA
ncbi:SCO6745 family protein [Actinosynnema sp. CS-041913]|uniref:SCO6745 family protein n=1 Tax=Actinosynnema sp. CS-041913 TaxID=3239917 RepID=UPI003D9075DF